MTIVLIGSFLVTLWLTDTGSMPGSSDNRPASELFANHKVSNRSELIDAAIAVGLHSSDRMKGTIEGISRINDQQVTITGWLADLQGDDTPLNILVFVAGAMVGIARTHGERPDVTNTLGLAFGAEKNVSFQVSFSCSSGEQSIVVGFGIDKDYFPFVSPRCP